MVTSLMTKSKKDTCDAVLSASSMDCISGEPSCSCFLELHWNMSLASSPQGQEKGGEEIEILQFDGGPRCFQM